MAEVIRMPRMSDTMEEGVIAAWHKKVGDNVAIGELLAEIETDKATMDFESPKKGVLLHIGVEKGQSVKIDGVLAVIGEKGEDFKALLEKEKQPEKKKQETAKDDSAEKETKQEASAEKEKKQEEPADKKEKQPQVPSAEKESDSKTADGRIKASPLAKKMAEEKGVKLSQVKGSGDDGRIIKRDIESFSEKKPAATEFGVESSEDVAHTQMRKTIAKRLAASKYSAPHYYITMEINKDSAMEARKGVNEVAAPIKVSFNDMIVKAASVALRKHPYVNASWTDESIRLHHHIHIGVAVAVDQGLVVPVIRFADGKSLSQIADETKALAGRAREGKLKSDEMQGNTFTISNLGMFDIDEFTAIINPPASCILAVGRIIETPVVKNGNIKTAHLMKVTMSCDHRVVDGATGARFLQTFKQLLENPVMMLV